MTDTHIEGGAVPPAPTAHFPYSSTEVSTATSQTSISKGVSDEATITQPQKSFTLPQDKATQRTSADLPPRAANARHLIRMETAPMEHESVPALRRAHTDMPPIVKTASMVGSKRRPRFKKGEGVKSSVPDHSATYRFDDYSSTDSDTSANEDKITQRHKDGRQGDGVEGHNKARTRSSADRYNRFSVGNENYKTKGKVSRRDGRLKISIKDHTSTGYLAKSLSAGIKRQLRKLPEGRPALTAVAESATEQALRAAMQTRRPIPRMNIVVMVIGSRGDIQPFIKIGKILKEEYGHRVRIATHPAFKKFVEKDSGLEFFSVGGDPSELMAFMVKNPGLIPSVETVRQGEIGRRRAAMFEMFQGMWRACINATDDESNEANLKMMGSKHAFVADAIIANPPSFAHVHIAERLGIPLHMMFTFPYTPTTQFPHPLANIKRSNVDANYSNFVSYPLVDMMTWQGLGDLVNRFRTRTLGLEPVSTLWAPGQLYRLKVPYTYMWSPGLVPKPEDWGPEIDISGFVFLELASSFKPSQELSDFIEAGPPPIYIGFGSIVVDDPEGLTKMIFDAVKIAGVRALVSKGWGGFGGSADAPENVFMLGNTPHDWLFPRVQAVVHHGGAGTTAMGLKCGRPTMIVPFFGDQPFWGAMVSSAKAGAHECIPWKDMTTAKLAEGIKQCLTDEAKKNARGIADSIAAEGDGAANAVKSFHRSLPLHGPRSMRCSILEDRVAAWQMKGTKLRLSSVAADVLIDRKKLKWDQLRLIRHRDWTDFGGPGGPLSGVGISVVRTAASVTKGFVMIPVHLSRSIKKREAHNERKKRMKQRQEKKLEQMHSNDGHGPLFVGAKKVNSHPDEPEPVRPANPRADSDPMLNRPRPSATRNETNFSKISADPTENIFEEMGHETAHGLSKASKAIVKAPMDLSVAVAQGFHNAPRLYGDETVRRPLRISGFHSGVRAGRNEFIYGIHDAFTGLYTHPRDGVKRDGAFGLVKGVATGLGGLVLKNMAAALGPGAYAMKGLHMELRKRDQPTGSIRRARILQGRDELAVLSAEDAEDVVETTLRGWDVVRDVIESEMRKREEARRRSPVKRLVDATHINIVAKMGESHKEKMRTRKLRNVDVAERTLFARRHGKTLDDMEDETAVHEEMGDVNGKKSGGWMKWKRGGEDKLAEHGAAQGNGGSNGAVLVEQTNARNNVQTNGATQQTDVADFAAKDSRKEGKLFGWRSAKV